MTHGPDRLPDDEIVHRRVPPSMSFDGFDPPRPPWQVFRPREPSRQNPNDKGDANGISVDRACLRSAVQTSVGRNPQRPYSVVALGVRQIRAIIDGKGIGGMDVVADSLPDNAAHGLIPQINIIDYQQSPELKRRITEWAERMAQLCSVVFTAPKT